MCHIDYLTCAIFPRGACHLPSLHAETEFVYVYYSNGIRLCSLNGIRLFLLSGETARARCGSTFRKNVERGERQCEIERPTLLIVSLDRTRYTVDIEAIRRLVEMIFSRIRSTVNCHCMSGKIVVSG